MKNGDTWEGRWFTIDIDDENRSPTLYAARVLGSPTDIPVSELPERLEIAWRTHNGVKHGQRDDPSVWLDSSDIERLHKEQTKPRPNDIHDPLGRTSRKALREYKEWEQQKRQADRRKQEEADKRFEAWIAENHADDAGW